MEELKKNDTECIQGNHDRVPAVDLETNYRTFLETLPEHRMEGEFFYTHISPRERQQPIKTAVEAWNVFDETGWQICFIGHLHFSTLFGQKSREKFQARSHAFQYNQPYPLDKEDRYIISPGPVGYSRDEVDKIRYAIFDWDNYSIEFRVVDGPLFQF